MLYDDRRSCMCTHVNTCTKRDVMATLCYPTVALTEMNLLDMVIVVHNMEHGFTTARRRRPPPVEGTQLMPW